MKTNIIRITEGDSMPPGKERAWMTVEVTKDLAEYIAGLLGTIGLEEEEEPDLDDKQAICKALLPVLRMTRAFFDLVDLEYEAVEGKADLPEFETVTATFSSGFKKRANVSLDSGASMIIDIIKQLI